MSAPPGHHRRTPRAWGVACGLLVWCRVCGAADGGGPDLLPPPASQQVDFARDIRPVLETSCLRCHGPVKPKSGFRLDNRRDALKGGDNGADIVPGDSANSPLIRYVAGLVENLQMPPPDMGEPLTSGQVALLRAWIDQGAAWDTNAMTNRFTYSVSPAVGGTAVSGNQQKFRELNGVPAGANGGLESFEMSGRTGPDTKYSISGRVLRDDYKLGLSLDQSDLGYIHAGWDQYRKYYSDTGGYYPAISPAAPDGGRDLHLDIGKAWVDFGLTLPHWPRMSLGYEYDYRDGTESLLNWGLVAPGSPRAIAPAAQNLNEGSHVIKFDLDDEVAGAAIEERFRAEFYTLSTRYTNTDARGGAAENAREQDTWFQGANTIRVEKKFNDWAFASAGYLYSELNSDASFSDSVNNTAVLLDSAPGITLEKESHVLNANGLLGPWEGLSFSTGVESEWTRQRGFGGNNTFLNPVYTNGFASPVVSGIVLPTILSSDYDQNTVTENAALRFDRIPFTTLFLELKLQQEGMGQGDDDIQTPPATGFQQYTAFSSQLSDLRAGFSTSPWRAFSLSAHYRRHEDDSHYNNDPGLPPPGGYPGFIRARDLLTDEFESKLSWHPYSWVKTAFTFQHLSTSSWTDTDPSSPGASPGGGLYSGEYHSQVYSLNVTLNPTRRLFLSTTFTYQPSTTVSAADNASSVAAYRGETTGVLAGATYALSQNADVFASYSYSGANYAQNNFAAGLPVGLQYEQHAVQAGVSRQFGKNVTARLGCGYYYYAEPASGGGNNYSARSIFATLTFKGP